MKPIIVHITADYPDPMSSRKTPAVRNLVEGTPQYQHIVYSLNRVNGWSGTTALSFGTNGTAVAYRALPRGFFWKRRLHQLADWIAADMGRKGLRPNLIEAHKFTVEGVVGLRLSRLFAAPLISDLQGASDYKILRFQKSLRGCYREIAQQCRAVLAYSHWPVPAFVSTLGLDPEKCHYLPVVPNLDTMVPSAPRATSHLISVFHLDGWLNKNIPGMVRAIELLKSRGRRVTLDVYGGGSAHTVLHLQNWIEKRGLQDQITLKGPVDNSQLQALMNDYAAFIMPSKEETYGLVYVEALFSGLPIIMTRNRGIDGYVSSPEVGYACDPYDSTDIALGIEQVLDNEAILKGNIARLQREGRFEFMRRSVILQTYSRTIDKVLAGAAA